MDLKNLLFGLFIGVRKLDFSINTARTNQRRIERFNLVGRHNDFHVGSIVETVQLVQKLQHSALDFFLTTRTGVETFVTNCIDFIDENNGRRVFSGGFKQLSHQFRTLAGIFLDEFRTNDTQEGGGSLIGHCFSKQGFACSGTSVENHAFRRTNAHIFIDFGMR